MVDVNITDKGRRTGKQPTHGPWGGKDADLLSNPKATAVFPPTEKLAAVPKANTTEKGSEVK